MIDRAIAGMEVAELRAEIQRIDQEVGKLTRWATLAGTDYGKFIVQDKRERLALIIQLYGGIDMGEDKARTKVARIQGYEEYLREDIAKLSDAESYRKRLASYLGECHTVLQHKLKARTETVDNIVSGATQGDKNA